MITYYINYKLSLPELKCFIRQLSKHFDFLMDFDNYLRIICDARFTDTVRSKCAEMLIIAAKIKVEISGFPAKSDIVCLMLILPDNIEEIGCQNTILILLEAFRLYNVNQWPKECIENYIHHALGIFLHLGKNLEYLEWQRLQLITESTTLQFQRLKRQLKEVKEKKNNHKFNNDLPELLIILAEHRLNIFKHVFAVAIYNLYRRESPLKYKQFMSILEKHKELVDNLKCIESPSSMRVHVVLLILQMTGKVLDVQPIGNHSNRLKVLNNLDIFLRDADFLDRMLVSPSPRKWTN
uniref:Uncharacterized protein n=1 Tax=Glossina pallidipes TaxID=7398 RepID=A0A1A9ZXH3_GLOPL